MKFVKRASVLAVSLGAALALMIMTPFAANAVSEPLIDTDGFIQIEPGSTSAEIDAQVLAALQELAGKQTPEQIERLSQLPGTAYWVPVDNGIYASAVNIGPPEPVIAAFAVIGGQFCTAVNMCVRDSGGGAQGFAGTGILSVWLPSVVRVDSGNLIGSATTTLGNVYLLPPWSYVTFGGATTVNVLTRG